MLTLDEIYKQAPTKYNILNILREEPHKQFTRQDLQIIINPNRKDLRYKESIRTGLRKLTKDGFIVKDVVDNRALFSIARKPW